MTSVSLKGLEVDISINELYLIFRVRRNSKIIRSLVMSRKNFYCVTNSQQALIFNRNAYNFFKCWVLGCISGLAFGWVCRFVIVGYHYVVKASRLRNIMKLKLGFRYRILLVLPRLIRIFPGKRKFVLVGHDFSKMLAVCKYIRNLRNLFPYKRKGLVYELEKLKLKPGKKAKTR